MTKAAARKAGKNAQLNVQFQQNRQGFHVLLVSPSVVHSVTTQGNFASLNLITKAMVGPGGAGKLLR